MRPTLESSPALRLMTLCAMYLAQGMPFGFVAGTLAAYLATQGYGLADVARVTFMAQLPWTFKFIWGPIIDRYDFSEFGLGRRRPWILLAQSMMVTTLMMILFLPDLSQAMTTLVWIIAIHNVFASLQDVSVDALAVDLLPEKERGKANGFMRAASYLGSIIGGSVMGIITARHGLQLAIALQVAIMLLVMCAPLFLRERAGERLFPWQPKGAAPKPPSSARKSTESFSSIRRSLNKAFSLKSTRLAAVLAIVVLAGTTLLSAVSKILILDKLGWSLEAYSKWITGFGYFFALGGALLGGVLADLFTARRVAGVATVVLGAVWVGFSLLEPQWANRSVIIGYIFAEQFCIGIMTVSLYAIFMGVSWPAIAATQFTAYMALLNLSLTGGTRLAGMMGNEPDFRLIYLAAGAVQIVFLFLIRWIDVSETRRILGEEAADDFRVVSRCQIAYFFSIHVMRILACLLILLAPLVHAVQQPNVLFIAIDDLNDWVNCMGGRSGVHTPHLDRLAKRGVLFTNAHCAAPACNPSRVAIMTGVAPASSGVYNNGQDWRRSPRLAKAVTLPEHFRAGGYEAFGGGKIFHCLSWINDGYGKQQNEAKLWDRYWPAADRPMPDPLWPKATEAKRAANGYLYSKPIAVGKDVKGRPPHFFDWAPDPQPESKTADHQVVDWAIGELMQRRPRPFFQAVGIFRPHIPWYAPEKYFALYPENKVFLPKVKKNDLADVPPAGHRSIRKQWHEWLVKNDEWRGAVRGYLASISFADAQVGRLLNALDKSPHAKDTIIVLWSDHGMHIGEKQQWEKFTLFEESTRVPLMIVAPGVTKGGGVCDRPVNLLDVYPTLNELCQLPARKDLDGVSLVPLLKNPKAKWDRPAVTTWGRDNHAVRGQRYRYIRHPNGTEQLYDHQSDPDEFTNLAARPELAAVKARLAQWLPKTNAAPVRNKK